MYSNTLLYRKKVKDTNYMLEKLSRAMQNKNNNNQRN